MDQDTMDSITETICQLRTAFGGIEGKRRRSDVISAVKSFRAAQNLKQPSIEVRREPDVQGWDNWPAVSIHSYESIWVAGVSVRPQSPQWTTRRLQCG